MEVEPPDRGQGPGPPGGAGPAAVQQAAAGHLTAAPASGGATPDTEMDTANTNVEASAAPPAAALAAPVFDIRVIAPNELTDFERIGKGSYGYVEKCKHRGRLVACKFFEGAYDEERRELFETEARLLASVRSPSIVALYGWHISEARWYIVTELMQWSLADVLHSRASVEKKEKAPLAELTPLDKVRLLLSIAAALADVHACGIAHRDLKSANVLVNLAQKRGGAGKGIKEAKLADFGSSVLAGGDEGRERVFGTLQYMPPEVFKAGAPASGRFAIDMYSFGTLCWEVWTRQVPYRGRFDTDELLMAFIIGQLGSGRALPHALPEDAPPDLRGLLLACWSVRPELRPTALQAHEALSALERALTPAPAPPHSIPAISSRSCSSASFASEGALSAAAGTARREARPLAVLSVQPPCCAARPRRPRPAGPAAPAPGYKLARLLRVLPSPASERLQLAVQAPSLDNYGPYTLTAEAGPALSARYPNPLYACELSFDPPFAPMVRLRPADFVAGKAVRVYLSDGAACSVAVAPLADTAAGEDYVQLELWPEGQPPRGGRRFHIAAELIPHPGDEMMYPGPDVPRVASFRDATPAGPGEAPGQGYGAGAPSGDLPAASPGRLLEVHLSTGELHHTRLNLRALEFPSSEPPQQRARLAPRFEELLGVHAGLACFEAFESPEDVPRGGLEAFAAFTGKHAAELESQLALAGPSRPPPRPGPVPGFQPSSNTEF
eukprot:tig00000711_g3434.t1